MVGGSLLEHLLPDYGTNVANSRKSPRTVPPLDDEALQRVALRYVERFATTRGKLAAYLARKLRERGWHGAGSAEDAVAQLVENCADKGYVNDELWAQSRSRSLSARGYGARRIGGDLRAAGIEEDLRKRSLPDADGAFDAAESFARKRRIGPFAINRMEDAARRKALAAMLRAGHSFELARAFVEAAPGEVPERHS